MTPPPPPGNEPPPGPGDSSSLGLDEVRAAAARVAAHVRRTPTIEWRPREWRTTQGQGQGQGQGHGGAPAVFFKLEHMQIGGSFKARGAINRLAVAPPEEVARGVVTASGGNHGIGVAWAASRFGAPATIYLPQTAPASSQRLLESMGARTVRQGAAWDDAWRLARADAEARGALAVHPFEDPVVIAGQGTVALEFLEDVRDLDALVVAIGGGGLIGGVALVARALAPGLRIVGVEPEGAPSMKAALAADAVVELPSVTTIAGTLAPRAVGPTTLALARALVDEIVLVSDDELRAAMRLLWRELRQLVEPAGAAAMAALVSGRSPALAQARRVGVLLCGANLDVDSVLGG